MKTTKEYVNTVLILTLFLAGGVLPTSLPAQSGTWINPNGGSWTNSANWSGGVIATNTDSTADFSTLTLSASPSVTLDGALTVGNLIFDDQNATKHNWALNTGGGGPLTLAVSSGAPTITVNSGVTNTIGLVLAGTGGLTKAGAGTLYLNNTGNSYSGGTTISAGTLEIVNGAAGYTVITLGDANTSTSNVELDINNLQVTNAVTVANQGSGSATISYLPASVNSTLSLGNITLNRAATISLPNLGGYVVCGSIFAGSGNLTIGSTASQRLILFGSASPSYSGNIDVQNGGLLEPRAVLSSTSGNSVIVEDGGIFRAAYGTTTIDALNGVGLVDSANKAGTLVVGKANGSGTFTGTMMNHTTVLSFTKTGTGTQVLSGPGIIYTGGTTVNGGTLSLSNTLAFASAVTVTSPGVLDLNINGTTWTFGRAVSGTGSFTKSGTGAVILSLAQTYRGTTTVNAGTLSVAGLTGGGAVTVVGGATLGGNGPVSGAVTVNSDGNIEGPDTGTLGLSSLTFDGAGAIVVANVAASPYCSVNGIGHTRSHKKRPNQPPILLDLS